LGSVGVINGDLPQSQRDRVMASFRAEKLTYLIATDVIGRGIDISGVSHIVNYDLPVFCDDYVHRVGRTGRMGREGVAYTFVTPEEGYELTRIEDRINLLLKRDEIAGFDTASTPERIGDADDEFDESGIALPKTAPPPPPPSGRRQRTRRRAL
jgi:ATP-dependent RNA helicase DeaD